MNMMSLNFSSCREKKSVEQNEHDGFEFLKLQGKKKKNSNKMNKKHATRV